VLLPVSLRLQEWPVWHQAFAGAGVRPLCAASRGPLAMRRRALLRPEVMYEDSVGVDPEYAPEEVGEEQEDDADDVQDEGLNDTRWFMRQNILQTGTKIDEELFPLMMSPDAAEWLKSRRIYRVSKIQAKAFTKLRRGLSAVVYAETGSGKTLAYLLPILERLRDDYLASQADLPDATPEELDGSPEEPEDDRMLLIVAPTRNLAVQLVAEAERFVPIGVRLVANGARARWASLERAKVVVATPMELMEVLDEQPPEDVAAFMQRVEAMVLDEFDLLLPDGRYNGNRRATYMRDGVWPTYALIVRLIRNNANPKLQVVAVSASAYPKHREQFRAALLEDKKKRWKKEKAVRLIKPWKRRQASPTLPDGIRHFYWRVAAGDTNYALAAVGGLEKMKPNSAFIFVCPNAGETVKAVARDLERSGYTNVHDFAYAIAPGGSRSGSSMEVRRKWRKFTAERTARESAKQVQRLREASEQGFDERNLETHRDAPIFVVPEGSARGLDYGGVEAVFILGMPSDAASYMHMAGRTGRLPHPQGSAVHFGSGMQIDKVQNMFWQVTRINDWTYLGKGHTKTSAYKGEPETFAAPEVRGLGREEAAQRWSKRARRFDAMLGPVGR